MKGSRDHVAVYLAAADAASAPNGWKRCVDFRLGVVCQARRSRGAPARSAAQRGAALGGRSLARRALALRHMRPPRRGGSGAPQEEGSPEKSVWRTGQHEFNSETSDGTWGFSQARPAVVHRCSAPPRPDAATNSLQFITVSTLQSTPGLLVDDAVVIRIEARHFGRIA